MPVEVDYLNLMGSILLSLFRWDFRSSPALLKATLDQFATDNPAACYAHELWIKPSSNCEESTPDYDIVNYGCNEKGCRPICSRCLNAEIAKLDGLDKFEHFRFDPVEFADCERKAHVFHFRTRLFGPGVALDSFELRDGHPGGYQFQVIGDPQDDLLALLGRLIDKIRRALSLRHIGDGEFGQRIADHQRVQGMIGWDASHDGHLPLLIIDGQEITWDDFGRIGMAVQVGDPR